MGDADGYISVDKRVASVGGSISVSKPAALNRLAFTNLRLVLPVQPLDVIHADLGPPVLVNMEHWGTTGRITISQRLPLEKKESEKKWFD